MADTANLDDLVKTPTKGKGKRGKQLVRKPRMKKTTPEQGGGSPEPFPADDFGPLGGLPPADAPLPPGEDDCDEMPLPALEPILLPNDEVHPEAFGYEEYGGLVPVEGSSIKFPQAPPEASMNASEQMEWANKKVEERKKKFNQGLVINREFRQILGSLKEPLDIVKNDAATKVSLKYQFGSVKNINDFYIFSK